jgi:deazaflavin-dependent oxidoreductase (nitroreductase family)
MDVRSSAAQRPAPWLRRLFRAPLVAYRWHLGWLFGHRLVLVEHVGRRTGQVRRVVLEVVEFDRATSAVVVASGFGPRADWYRNLLAHPSTTVVLGRRRLRVTACPVPAEEGGEIMRRYAQGRRRTARSMVRLLGYQVDGTDADFVQLGRSMPFLRLLPAGQAASAH